MNDFTKEELAVMHLAIIRDMDQFSHILKSSPSMLKLRDKLESMINNHCEHQKIKFDGDGYGCSCKNCDKQFRFTGQVIDADRHYKLITGDE
jgi:hypothetical protein